MINSLRKALSPCFIIVSCLGLYWFDCRLVGPQLCCVAVYTFLLWCFNLALTAYMLSDFRENLDSVLSLIAFGFHFFTTTAAVCEGVYYRQKFKKCLERIAIVDNTLEALGTAKDYQKLFYRVLWYIATWFLFSFTVIAISIWFYLWVYETFKAIYVTYTIMLYIIVNMTLDTEIAVIMEYIGTRFDSVNAHIQRLLEDQMNRRRFARNRLFSIYRNTVNDENSRRLIWTAMHLHAELCRITRELHAIVEVHTFCQMGSFFALTVGLVLYVPFSIQLVQEYGFILALLAPYVCSFTLISRLFAIIYFYESISGKATATTRIIKKLSHHCHDSEMRKDVMQLVLQMRENPLRFSGLGLFYFDYNFIQRFYTYILTVFVMLLQTDVIKYIQFTEEY